MHRPISVGLIGCFLLASPLLGTARIGSARMSDRGSQVMAATVTVIDETAAGVTVELEVPSLAPEKASRQGFPCELLTAPGLGLTSAIGQPIVPTRGVFLAVSSLADLRLEVVESIAEPLAFRPLCAAAQLEAASPIEQIAATSPGAVGQNSAPSSSIESETPQSDIGQEIYPGMLAEIRTSGILRGQPVVLLQFYPLQVDNVRHEIILYSRLRVRVSHGIPAGAVRPARAATGPFELLFRDVLLNEPLPAPEDASPRAFNANQSPDLSPFSSVTAAPPLKVLVDHEGIVRITATDLATAGWDVAGLDLAWLTLVNQGREAPLWIEDHGDGFAGDDDFILFYNAPLTGRYSHRNVYWLSMGQQPGLRMTSRSVTPSHSYPVASHFHDTLHFETDSGLPGYWQNPPGKEAQDHWYWTGKLTAPARAELPFWMPAFEPEPGSITLRVLLAGRTDDWAVSPDHHTRVELNDTFVDEAWWDGHQEFTHSVTLPEDVLLPGNNTLVVETVGGTGARVDQIYGNWIEVDYRARYVSHNDRLAFAAPGEGNYRFRVTGFTGDSSLAFDLTDPAAPVRLVGVLGAREGDRFEAVLEDYARVDTRYLVMLGTQTLSPDGLIADEPSNLRDSDNGADEIIITYDAFYEEALRLAAHRQAQGLRVVVARVTDVFDEFSGGISTPEAIREFLSYAYRYWRPPAPTYVLLVGDAHLDYLDRFGTGSTNFVPSFIFDATGVGETAYDDWFACVDGDDIFPDIFLGRLTVRSIEDARVMVNKIIAYESQAPGEQWRKRAIFVADDGRPDFETSAERWIRQLPPSSMPLRIFAGRYPPGDPQSDIVTSINAGAFLVSYVGHGNQDRWGSWQGGSIFNSSTVPLLDNEERLPFVVTATCLDGFFVNPFLDYCLAEQIARKPDGGAIAVWAPTALGFAEEHEVLFARLFERLYETSRPGVGRVTAQAKLAAYGDGISAELAKTFALFGDPALRLWIPGDQPIYLPLVRGSAPP